MELKTKIKTTILTLRYSPGWRSIFRLIRGYLRVNLLGKNQLRLVELFVTLACNANCSHCSNGLFTSKKSAINLNKYLSIIDECAKLNVPIIALIGGEPLLYKNLDVLVKHISSHGILPSVSTNGYLLDEDKVKELAQCGLRAITISLLSPDAEKHDSLMELKGAFQRALKAKDYCEKYNVSYSRGAVVSHSDFVDGSFEKLVEFATKNKILLSINHIIPTGYAKDNYKNNLMTNEDIQKLNKISTQSSYISTHLTNNYFGFGCPAGNAYLGVNASGEIFPCFFFPVSLGNIHEMSLKQAWEKACHSPLFTRRHKMCYLGVSREFHSEYLYPIFDSDSIPIPIEKHPKYDQKLEHLPDIKSATEQ